MRAPFCGGPWTCWRRWCRAAPPATPTPLVRRCGSCRCYVLLLFVVAAAVAAAARLLLFYCFRASRYSGNKVHTDTHGHTNTNSHIFTHTRIHLYADYPLRPRLYTTPCLPTTPASMHTVHLLSLTSPPKPPALRRVRLSPGVLMIAWNTTTRRRLPVHTLFYCFTANALSA